MIQVFDGSVEVSGVELGAHSASGLLDGVVQRRLSDGAFEEEEEETQQNQPRVRLQAEGGR